MKRGQVAIFVIIGLFMIAAIALLIFINSRGSEPSVNVGDEFEVESFMRECVRDIISEKSTVIVEQGGFYSPRDSVVYEDINVSYLCKNINYYQACINQYPVYISDIKESMEEEIYEDVGNCFNLLEQELDSKDYEFSGENYSVNIELKPGIIEVVVERDMSVSQREITRSYSLFVSQFASPLYDLAFVAQEIVSQESRYCYFEYVGFSLLYPKYLVKKYTLSDSTKIYTIIHKSTGKSMNIAVRGCAIPAGF